MQWRLPDLMKSKGLNAYRLSTLLDGKIGRASVYRLVAGRKAKVSPEEVAHLCGALGVSPNELFGFNRLVYERKAKGGKT